MATLASLRILLGLDSGDVTRGAGKVRQELTGVQRSANTARDALRGVAAGFGLGAGIGAFQLASRAVSEFTDLIGDSVEAAIAEEAGIKRLDQALKANIAGWDGNTAAIERTIEARQALGFADDEQRDSLGRLVAATGDVNQALSIQATAMDLARFKGISLAEASDALIKVESGQFRALKALGIELRDGATQTEALAAVQKVAAGQAVEFGKTTAGAMAEAGIAIDNLKEDFGTLIMPVLGDGARLITNDLIPTLELAGQGFKNLAADALSAIPGVDAFFDALGGGADDAGISILDFLPMGSQLRTAYEMIGEANLAAAEGAAQQASELDRARQLHINTTITARTLGAEMKELGVDILLAGNAADDAGANLRHFAGDVRGLTQDINDANAALAHFRDDASGIPSQLNVTQDFDPTHPGGSPTGLHPAAAKAERDRIIAEEKARRDAVTEGEKAARDAEAAAREAMRQAEQDARDAQQLREQGWRDAQEAADQYFDRVHRANQDVIDDIRDQRNAQLDAANAAVQGVVDAERDRLDAIRDAEREAGLRSAVAGAETPDDLLAAQRDLQRFLEDERVEFMQGQADANVALNEAARENANAAADMAVAAEALRDIAARERFDPRVTMTEGGSVASVNLADFLNDAPIQVNVYIDGERVTETVDRRLNTRRTNISPTSVSTGSAR